MYFRHHWLNKIDYVPFGGERLSRLGRMNASMRHNTIKHVFTILGQSEEHT
jgi:hypothetical protein